MKPRLALLNSLYWTKAKRTVFGNLWGGPHGHPEEGRKEMKAQKAKMKGNESPKGQMNAQKAKMKGNESPKGQNERK